MSITTGITTGVATIWNRVVDFAGRAFGKAEVVVHDPLVPITKPYVKQVSPALWRGSWPDSGVLMLLGRAGVRASINLCKERDQDALVWSCNLLSFDIPILDNGLPSSGQLQYFNMLLDHYAPLYVHCEEGIGRTGCMVAWYRVMIEGQSPAEALVEAESFGLCMPDQKAWILSLKE